jgi:hypothetical protein
VVWRREIKTKQPKQGCDQPFGLAQRQAENRPQRQRRRDRQCRVARLAAARRAGLGLPRRNRGFREPHGQAPALAQGDKIGGPIRHSVPLLWDVMTAILVRFEWHGDRPRSGTGATSYTIHSSSPNDRSVQQGHARWYICHCSLDSSVPGGPVPVYPGPHARPIFRAGVLTRAYSTTQPIAGVRLTIRPPNSRIPSPPLRLRLGDRCADRS